MHNACHAFLSRRYPGNARLASKLCSAGCGAWSDVDDELAFHLAAKADALQRAGWRPDAARDEALRQFGDLAAAREQLVAADLRSERQSQHLRLLDDFWRDLAVAARSLRRSPAFTAVAVLVLALGIGVVSGAFHLVDIYALKPALIEEPNRVLSVYSVQPQRRGRLFSFAEYTELRARVIGSPLRVNGEALAVAGVAARGFTGTMALLGSDELAATAASWLPVRRALKVEPSAALREE